MLRAYRLIIAHYEYAPPQLWEWQQPHIDNLSRSARTFGHYMKQRSFLNKDVLNRENTRIWRTHYKPKPAPDHTSSWQEMLAEHRQNIQRLLTTSRPHQGFWQRWFSMATQPPTDGPINASG